MNFVYLMDPLEDVVLEKDTSLMLMLGAHRKGHRVFFLPRGGLVHREGKVYFHVEEVVPQYNAKQPFLYEGSRQFSEDDVDVVFIRTDPPFNSQYLMDTWLLDLLPKRICVINSPSGIRTVNEKIWSLRFPNLIPRSCVSAQKEVLKNFLSQEKDVIAKPTDSFGGRGIFHLQENAANVNVTLETLTDHWSKEIILQQYIPEATIGDKRILLLNGEPLGAILRQHGKDDHRNNFFSGGKPLPTEITDRDLEIIATLKPHLQRLGLFFVGIDIIGDYLIEVNVTSPTCLQEMNRANDLTLENDVIAFVEKTIDQN